jgi:hypothetical protein
LNEITEKQKIETLERIVLAVFGRQSKEITYRSNCEDMMEVHLECDVDDALKVLDNLKTASIESDFFTSERQLENPQNWEHPWEGYTEITLYLETEYWKKAEQLTKEIQVLRQELELAKQTQTITGTTTMGNVWTANGDQQKQ